jgi:hypothetical protein
MRGCPKPAGAHVEALATRIKADSRSSRPRTAPSTRCCRYGCGKTSPPSERRAPPPAHIVGNRRLLGVSHAIQPAKNKPSLLPTAGPFGNIHGRISSGWRSARYSVSSEARVRNNPISPHQIGLQNSIIEQMLHPIHGCSPVALGFMTGDGSFHIWELNNSERHLMLIKRKQKFRVELLIETIGSHIIG